mgnify:FL=1
MNTRKRNSISLALAVGLCLSGVAVNAAEADFSKWKCDKCEFPEGAKGNFELGGYNVSESSARFGDYTGLNEDGSYALANAMVSWWGKDGMWFNLDGRNLGLDSHFLSASGGLRGLFDIEVYVQNIPRHFADDSRSPLTATGLGVLSLPGDWIRGADTGSMPNLASSLAPSPLGYDRENQGLEFNLTPVKYLSVDAQYREETRDGNRRNWGNFLSYSTEFAQPVAYTTDEYTVGLDYARDNWTLRAEYYGSTFESGFDAIVWDNPYSGPGPEFGQKAVAPDNEFHQTSLSGTYRFDLWRTLVSARIATGLMKQTNDFLPYSVNPGLVSPDLPRNHLDGKVDTTNTNLKISTNPTRDLRLTAEYRTDERDNQTPVDTYTPILADSLISSEAFSNAPYSFKREDMRLKGVYRWSGIGSIQAGYDYKRFERDLQERTETTTDRMWATFQVRPGNSLDGFFTLATETRDGTDYQSLVNQAPQNPLMRKYNMADRDRDSMRLQLSYIPTDIITLGLSGEYNEDTYSNSTLGLTAGDYSNIALDGSIQLPANSSLYILYSHENINSEQAGSQGFADPNWTASVEDVFDTAVVGITVPAIKDRLDLKLDYTYTDSSSQTDMVYLNSSSAYPEQTAQMDMIKLYADYKYSDNLSLRAGYWYEKYDSVDWSMEGVNPSTIYNVLSLGAQPQAYDQGVAWISFVYEFGKPEPEED